MKELVGGLQTCVSDFWNFASNFFMIFQILTKRKISMVYIQKFIKMFEAKFRNSETPFGDLTSSFICCSFCSDKFKTEGMGVNRCKIVTSLIAQYIHPSLVFMATSPSQHHHESMCRLATNILIYCMQTFYVFFFGGGGVEVGVIH